MMSFKPTWLTEGSPHSLNKLCGHRVYLGVFVKRYLVVTVTGTARTIVTRDTRYIFHATHTLGHSLTF